MDRVTRAVLKQELEELKKQHEEFKEGLSNLSIKINELKYELDEDSEERFKKNFRLHEDHLKLLKEIEFKEIDGGDLVCMGVDGKRPFGNSYMVGDIARILKWKLIDEDLSDKQHDKAWKLLKELPLALNKILKKLQPKEMGF